MGLSVHHGVLGSAQGLSSWAVTVLTALLSGLDLPQSPGVEMYPTERAEMFKDQE